MFYPAPFQSNCDFCHTFRHIYAHISHIPNRLPIHPTKSPHTTIYIATIKQTALLQKRPSSYLRLFVVLAGASLNTDIGPDSEAQIAPQHDDYDADEQDHHHNADDDDAVASTTVNEKHATNGNGNGHGKQEKTNTPV